MAATTGHRHELPMVKHLYQNHHIDSLRWNFFQPRLDDIVIATSYKAGTTWMQGIVANLIFSGQPLPAPLGELSPWLDSRIIPLELVLTGLGGQTQRRFIKTHLPLDGLLFHPHLKYIYVARDARDVFMSFWNHYRSFTDAAMTLFNTTPGRVGPELPRCPDDIHEL
jgi:aryl sulfotransferase